MTETILQKWLAPTGVMVFIGGIVWGIQLNVAVMQLTAESSETRGQIKEITTALANVSKTQETTAYIIARLEEDLKAGREELTDHIEEAEQWKYKIIKLEENGSK